MAPPLRSAILRSRSPDPRGHDAHRSTGGPPASSYSPFAASFLQIAPAFATTDRFTLGQALSFPEPSSGYPWSYLRPPLLKTFPTLAPDVLQIASTSSRSVRASALAHWPCSHTIPYELRWPQNSGFSPTPGQRCAFWVRLFHTPDNHHSETSPPRNHHSTTHHDRSNSHH